MITNAITDEFPCIEATRCLITEKEMGMRLTVKTLTKNNTNIGIGYTRAVDESQNQYIVTFSKDRKPTEEWYLHLDYARCDGDEGNETALRRVLQIRHSETGQYLCSDDKGRVSVTDISSPSTYWWMIMSKSSSTSSSSSLTSMSESSGGTDGQYILMSKEHAPRRLAYTTNLKGFTSDEDFQLMTSKNSGSPSTWELKFTSGELCFMSNPVMHCNLRCNLLGQLSLNSGLNGWEVFRFIEVGNGDLYISSWTHYTKFLSSNTDGQVYATDSSSNPTLGYAERWRLEPAADGKGLYLKNVASSRYLSVGRSKNEALWTTTKPNDYALWHVNAAHSHIYYLTSLFASTARKTDVDVVDDVVVDNDDDGEGLRPLECDTAFNDEDNDDVVVVKNNNITASDYNQIYSKHSAPDMHVSSRKGAAYLTKNKRKQEEWKVEVTPDGFMTFFSIAHEKYLGCNSKGDVHTTTSKGSWCFWEKQESLNGGVMFLSREHLRYLAVSEDDGSLCTTDGEGQTNLKNAWRLDPRLPRTVSGGKIAGAMGFAITIAMPFAVLGAVEAVGATITELALLGGVSVEALASLGAGAAIGVGMVGATAVLMPNDSNLQSEEMSTTRTDLPNEYTFVAQRPISGWKSWANPVSKSPPTSPIRSKIEDDQEKGDVVRDEVDSKDIDKNKGKTKKKNKKKKKKKAEERESESVDDDMVKSKSEDNGGLVDQEEVEDARGEIESESENKEEEKKKKIKKKKKKKAKERESESVNDDMVKSKSEGGALVDQEEEEEDGKGEIEIESEKKEEDGGMPSPSPTSVADVTSHIANMDKLEKGALVSPSTSLEDFQSKKLFDGHTADTSMAEIKA